MHPSIYLYFSSFKTLDPDGNGSFSLHDYRKNYHQMLSDSYLQRGEPTTLKQSKKDSQRLDEAFTRMDLDDDWNVSSDEYKKFYEATRDKEETRAMNAYSPYEEFTASQRLIKKYGKARKLP
jgi:hypothetical protein